MPHISRQDIARLFDLPFMDLLMQAQSVHREHFPANEVQISTLLSIKMQGWIIIITTLTPHATIMTVLPPLAPMTNGWQRWIMFVKQG